METKPDLRNILIIDGMNYFVRFFSVNESVTTSGEPCGGVLGFTKALGGLITQFSPQRVYVVWEQGGGCPRRKSIFPEYKANRAKLKSEFQGMNKDPTDLPSKRWIKDDKENKLKQVKILVDVLKNTPVCQLYVPETECDDVIGYLIQHKLKLLGAPKIIVSSDRDFYQLLDDPTVKIFNPATKSFHTGPVVKVKVAKDEFIDIPAKNYVVVRTMTGDDSDNIPGISGVGFKTALKLFPSLGDQSVDMNINQLLEASRVALTPGSAKPPSKIYSLVISGEEVLKRNWQLMYLNSGTLSATQINKIEYAVDNFQPKANKLGFIKALLGAGIISDINYDNFFYQIQRNLMMVSE